MILAIDTSTQTASLALYEGQGGVAAELTWCSASHHTVELAPYLSLLLQRVPSSKLSGLAVALGPGSFTGLRAGLSLAKGLTLALGIPLVGVPTLDSLAYSQRYQPLPICALLEAGRGRVCAAFYEKEGSDLRRVSDYLLTTVEELASHVSVPTLFCGEIDPQGADILQKGSNHLIFLASPASSLRRAGYLAELGWERLQRGGGDDPRSLEPLYLKRPVLPEDGL